MRGSGPNAAHATKVTTATRITIGTKYAGDGVGETLDRRASSLRLGDHRDDASEERLGADLLRAQDERARSVHGSADDAIAGALLHRNRLAGNHRLVDSASALDNDAVHRHLLARTHAQAVSGLDRVERHVLLSAAALDAARRLRREIEERADRRRGAPARAQLEHLPEQDQRDDDDSGLEVDGNRVRRAAKRDGEHAGHERRNHAVNVRDRNAEPDQREHVEAAIPHRRDRALVERPRGPHAHGRREKHLQERAHARRHERRGAVTDQHVPHREDEHGDRERG